MNRSFTPSTCIGFAAVTGLATVAIGQGGDDTASAVPIGLNAPDTGTTVGYANVSDEVCPYTGSTSPDVYYSYTPTTSHDLTVEICNSEYDTKVYVYDSSLNLITNVNGEASCNDDGCSSSGGGLYRSIIHCVPVQANQPYFVVVDGWGGESGDYAISLRDSETYLGDPDACAEIPPCTFGPCDPDHLQEGEICDDSGPDDCFNGGCNCTGGDPLAAFSTFPGCDTTVCGQGWFNGANRDTDWYRFDPVFVESYSMHVVAEFEAVIGRVDNGGMHDCEGVTAFEDVAVGSGPCEELHLPYRLICPGETGWLFVGANFTTVVQCGEDEPGNDYVATLYCQVNSVPIGCPNTCPGDFDSSGIVGFEDLVAMLAHWGQCSPFSYCLWNMNTDFQVDFQDLLLLLAAWGPCP